MLFVVSKRIINYHDNLLSLVGFIVCNALQHYKHTYFHVTL